MKLKFSLVKIQRSDEKFMTFAQKLETLRLSKGFTQEEIAKLVNISQPSYCAYERGYNLPHKNTQIQLAKVLGVTVEQLMNDEPVLSEDTDEETNTERSFEETEG